MQSAPQNYGESPSTWLPILHTLHSVLVSQGRVEAKVDMVLTKIGPLSSPTVTPPPPTPTEPSMATLDPHKLGKWLSLLAAMVRLAISIGPYVAIGARVLWKTAKPWLLG